MAGGRRTAVVLAALAGFALAGCGASAAGSESVTPPQTPAPLTPVPRPVPGTTTPIVLPSSPTLPQATTLPPTIASSSGPPAPADESLPEIVAPLTVPEGEGPVPTDAVPVPENATKNPTRPVGVPLGPEEGRVSGCTVSIVGDSLTVAGGQDMANALWAVGCSTMGIAAKGGANTWYGVRLQRNLLDSGLLAPIVVATMGTNDCAADPGEFDREIDAFMRVAGRDRLVVWPTTNISKVTPYCQPGGDDVANARIWNARNRYPNLYVVDWWTMANAHPEWHPDGVHHTAKGRGVWAATIADGVADAVRLLTGQVPSVAALPQDPGSIPMIVPTTPRSTTTTAPG